MQSTFLFNDDFVCVGDEVTHQIHLFDARTAQLVGSLSGHTGAVRAIAASPQDYGFMTGG